MNLYRVTYEIFGADAECQDHDWIDVVAESAYDAIEKTVNYISAERELMGCICDYDGFDLFVRRNDGNIVESYGEFKTQRL